MLKKLVIVGSLLAVGPLLAGCMTNSQALSLAIEAAPLVLKAADKATDAIKRNMAKSRRMAASEDRKTSLNVHTKTSSTVFITTNIASQTNNQLCRIVFGAPLNSAPRLSALAELRARGEQMRCRGGKHHSHSQSHLMPASRFDWMSKGELCHLATYGNTLQGKAQAKIREKGWKCPKSKSKSHNQGRASAQNPVSRKTVWRFRYHSTNMICRMLEDQYGIYRDTEVALSSELRRRGESCGTKSGGNRVQAQNERQRLDKIKRQRKAEERRFAEARRKRQAEEARHAEMERQRRAEAKRQAEAQRQAEAKRKAYAAKKSKLYRVGSGSGFSISRDGLIVTNHHVIDGCSAVAVSDKGEMYRAIVQSVDERNDLALLKSKLRPAHVFALNPEGTDILREIYVAGYPFGRMVSNSVKVTKGIVSSLVGLENNSAQIQIDAPIQVGNSGGPILDSEGRVVGVSVSKLDAFEVMKKKKQIPEGVGFGVKSETLIQMLKSSGVRTYKRGGLKTTAEIANAIRGGTFYISCLMTAERYKRLKGKKAMFEGVNLD